jgi:glucokinase
MTSSGIVAVDVGGTTLKAALLGSNGTVSARWIEPTPTGDLTGERMVEAVGRVVAKAQELARVVAVGVVVPGIVDEASGICIRSINLGWDWLPVRYLLTRSLQLPVAFGHDVRAAAMAEARLGGSARNPGISAFVAIGTGLAAAFTRETAVLEHEPSSGEIGQLRINSGAHAGLRIEEIASAGAIARRMHAPDALAVAELVRAGDPEAVRVWTEAVAALAEAICWIAEKVGPSTVVLGGGLSAASDIILPGLRKALETQLGFDTLPALTIAELGADAGMRGAGLYASDLIEAQSA